MRVTFRGKLEKVTEGQYTSFIFQNLDQPPSSLLRYITTTKCPNWTGETPKVGDIGYIECEYVNSGDTYFKSSTGENNKYKWNNCYFLHWNKIEPKINHKDYSF